MREYNCLASFDFLHEISRILSMCELVRKGKDCEINECLSCAIGYICEGKPACFGRSAEMIKTFPEQEIRSIINRVQEWSVNNPDVPKLSDEENTILNVLRLIGYKYIAADGVNNVFAFTEKPKKICGCWKATYACNEAMISHKGHLRGKVHYLDKEPLEIEALLR